MVELKVKKLHPFAKIELPKRPGDAGYDIYAVSYSIKNDLVTFKTGIAIEMPELPYFLKENGFIYVCRAYMKSSICNHPFTLTNAPGTIDFEYRGEIKAVFRYTGRRRLFDQKWHIRDAVRKFVTNPILQLTFDICNNSLPIRYVEELTPTERGDGGYGSTNELKKLT